MTIRHLILLPVLVACSGDRLPETTITHFSGPVVTTSPDGSVVYDELTSWVRRTVEPEAGRILEEVTQRRQGPRARAPDPGASAR